MPVGTKRFKLGDTTVALTVLGTKEDKAKGFMGAAEPPLDSAGLLFMNPSKSFWMKNVPFDLDLVGFDDSNRVVEILNLVAHDTNPVTFSAPNLKTAVELRSGWAADHNLTLGSELTPEGSRTFMVIENELKQGKLLAELQDLSKTILDPKKRTAMVQLTAKIHLGEHVGIGAGRVVFGIDDKLVLKVLRTYRPNNQNKIEAKTYECLGPDLAAKVLDQSDPDGVWIISERLRADPGAVKEWFLDLAYKALGPVAVERRYKSTGKNDSGVNAVIYALTGDHMDTQDKLVAAAPWLGDLAVKVFTCDVEAKDFHAGNWGFREGFDHPVLLDYGFVSHGNPGLGGLLENLMYEEEEGRTIEEIFQGQPEAQRVFEEVWRTYSLQAMAVARAFLRAWVASSPTEHIHLQKLLMDMANRLWAKTEGLGRVRSFQDFRAAVNGTPRNAFQNPNKRVFYWSDGDDYEGTRNYPRVEVFVTNKNENQVQVVSTFGNASISFATDTGEVNSIEVDGSPSDMDGVSQLLSDGLEEGLRLAAERFHVKQANTPVNDLFEHSSQGFLKSILYS